MTAYSPETRSLLIHFAACDWEKPLPHVDVDWDQTLYAILKHRIVGLTYYYLSKNNSPNYPPPEFQQKIRLLHYTNSRQMVKRYQSVREIISRLQQHHIDFMVVKGPVLGQMIYPTPAIRYFRDMDIIIRPSDRVAVGKALEEVGYRVEEDAIGYLPQLTPGVLALRHTQYFDRRQPDVLPIEVHWNNFLVDDLVLRNMGAIWDRAQEVTVEGMTIKAPSREDHLMHLCAHAHSHRFVNLFWLSDLLVMIRDHSEGFDWDLFTRTVVEEEIETPVYYSFKLVNALFGQEVPAEVMDATRPDRFRRWCHERFLPQEKTMLLSGEEVAPISFKSLPLFSSTVLNLLIMSRRQEKIGFLFRLLIPTSEWLRYRYHLSPDQNVLPYYFMRLFPPSKTLERISPPDTRI